jgi:hypothetical protein
MPGAHRLVTAIASGSAVRSSHRNTSCFGGSSARIGKISVNKDILERPVTIDASHLRLLEAPVYLDGSTWPLAFV